MISPPQPKIARAVRVPLIWLVPLVAAAIAGWMIFRELRQRGPVITIEFADAAGVTAGKTPLVLNGLEVGLVTAVTLQPNFAGVIVHARFHRPAETLAAAGTQFWIVHPEIGFSGVRGLETLLTGVRINVVPGRGATTTHFVGLDHPPPADNPALGRAFTLRSDRLGALTPGAPVYYREVKVGLVETSRLADDASSVAIRIRIFTPYVGLVRQNTEFWNAGGVSLKVGLLGAEIKSTSLESLLAGGVAFATPETDPLAPVAASNTEFTLAGDPSKDALKWRPKIPINPQESTPENTPREGVVPALLK